MSIPVVFKQRFNTKSVAQSAGLNVSHLQYISTRPGAVYNPGCGFGLWGHLPGMDGISNINILDDAKAAIREASAEHTVYRAIVSVNKETAQMKGLYDRSRWESLINAHIQDISKAMDIKPENMYWCASFHNERGHPHVHILYWDAGIQPRPEFMPKANFERMAEHIRGVFSGDLYREEIRELQQEQRTYAKELRTALQAVCLEANPEKGLNLAKLYGSERLKDLSGKLLSLVHTAPASGSLRYAYLPKDYKLQVDAFSRACLAIPEIARQLAKYERCTDQISHLYANSEITSKGNWEKAKKKLYKELGNQVMDAVREVKAEMQKDDRKEMFIKNQVLQIAVSLPAYEELKALLPEERIPIKYMGNISGYCDQLEKVVQETLQDARIRHKLERYARACTDQEPVIGTKHSLGGKPVSDAVWNRYQELHQDAKQEIRQTITEQVREDAGWTTEMVHTSTAALLCSIMRLVSQRASQRNAALSQARIAAKNRSKDMSKEDRMNYRAKQKQTGTWQEEEF